MKIHDIPALRLRQSELYLKSDEALADLLEHRNDFNDYIMGRLIMKRDRRYVAEVWLGASFTERQYIRKVRKTFLRAQRFEAKVNKIEAKQTQLEQVLITPELGENFLERYETGKINGKVWLDYANDPTNIFNDTRERIKAEETPTQEEAKA